MNEAVRAVKSIRTNISVLSRGIHLASNGQLLRRIENVIGLGGLRFPRPNYTTSGRYFHSSRSAEGSRWRKASCIVFIASCGAVGTYYLREHFTTLTSSILQSTNNTTAANCSVELTRNTEGFENSDNYTTTVDETNEIRVKLYQYQTCPFCCKVRAFLEYYGIEYDKIEVNPLMRKEIKFSSYRKVPIAIIGDVQLNDSSLIISILRSYMLGKGSLDELLVFYPKIETDTTKKKIEYANRHNVMYMEAMPTKEEHQAVREEAKWRKWVDETFVHTISPNIYRTLQEAFQAFEYFSEVGNFSSFERVMAKNCGAVFMFVLSKNLKKRYNLKDDVRESFYDEANKWMKAVGKKRKFMGGNKPNLADLSVYGVLSGIEGLDAFNDLMEHTTIKPWVHDCVSEDCDQSSEVEVATRASTRPTRKVVPPRTVDGLPLSASIPSDEQSGRDVQEYQSQAKKLFRKITERSPTRCSIETGPYVFHYAIGSGICYLVLCEKTFSKRLAFSYLEDIQNEFSREYAGQVATATRPYCFIEFDTYIQKARKNFMDSRNRRNLGRLNDELQDVQRIMMQNIDDVLQRGEQLSVLGEKAGELRYQSEKYRKDAKYLNLRSAYAKYAAIGILLFILVIYIRYWWF
eukprot:gene15880-17480_t